jgi:hypothetical protein
MLPAELLAGKANGDGLAAIFEHHTFLHRWVNRRVTWRVLFFHTHNLPSNSLENRARILRKIQARGIKIPSNREHFFAESQAFAQ